MNLVKTSFYTSISTAVTFITGFVTTKVVAVKIGPEGMAYYGQFVNTTSILTMLGTGAITTGVVKYLAEYSGNKQEQQKLISTSFVIVIVSSLVISLFTMACSTVLSTAAFKTKEFWIVYLAYGFCLTAVSMNAVFTSILNGLKFIKRLTIINIIASIVGMTSLVVLAYTLDLTGVLINISVVGLIMMSINIIMFKKWGVEWKFRFNQFDKSVLKKLLGFSLMAIVSGTVTPLMQILVRTKIIDTLSLQEAGYWQAVTRISDYYLSFISSVLVVYYMPRLSELRSPKEIRKEILYGYKMILPVVAVLSLTIWFLKDFIIHILFTPDFIGMRKLFIFQLIGDFLKIGSWLLAFLMLAKAMTKTFIVTEILFAAGFVIFSYLFVNKYGVIGATYAFALNYFLYWIVMEIVIKNFLEKEKR